MLRPSSYNIQSYDVFATLLCIVKVIALTSCASRSIRSASTAYNSEHKVNYLVIRDNDSLAKA